MRSPLFYVLFALFCVVGCDDTNPDFIGSDCREAANECAEGFECLPATSIGFWECTPERPPADAGPKADAGDSVLDVVPNVSYEYELTYPTNPEDPGDWLTDGSVESYVGFQERSAYIRISLREETQIRGVRVFFENNPPNINVPSAVQATLFHQGTEVPLMLSAEPPVDRGWVQMDFVPTRLTSVLLFAKHAGSTLGVSEVQILR
jgi:hypothetical protein